MAIPQLDRWTPVWIRVLKTGCPLYTEFQVENTDKCSIKCLRLCCSRPCGWWSRDKPWRSWACRSTRSASPPRSLWRTTDNRPRPLTRSTNSSNGMFTGMSFMNMGQGSVWFDGYDTGVSFETVSNLLLFQNLGSFVLSCLSKRDAIHSSMRSKRPNSGKQRGGLYLL